MRRASIGLAFLAFLASPVGVLTQAPPAAPVVVTHGEATVKRAADQAWLIVSAETKDARAADARRRNAETMTAVQRNQLRVLGIS